jgi:ADP-ribosylglycohydrolase
MTPKERAWLALEGVSVGDTFGERFFGPPEDATLRIARRELKPPPWTYTDDTEMAMSVYEVLAELGCVDQDVLACRFAARMEVGRCYGQGAYAVLTGIREGRDWRSLASNGFRGMGSFGNGAAMRVAPLGAYFADQSLRRIAEQARLSAEVTHAHPEGIAGAIAVAVATALAWRRREDRRPLGREWIREVRDSVPRGYTFDAIDEALGVAPNATIVEAAEMLGNGSGITAPDTVPLCLWVAARRSNDFAEALWETVAALGDRDTTCAIVGGILAVACGTQGIPAEWRDARETLPLSPPGAAEERTRGR